MKSIMKKFQSKFLLCMLMSLMVVSSYASAMTLSVTRYQQEKSKWCWAASAQMVGKYETGAKKSQSSIVKKIIGSVVNEGADHIQIQRALAYTTNKTGYLETTIPFTVLQGHIQSYEPFIMSIKWNTSGRHAVVCTGYRTKNGVQQIYVVDPAAGCSKTYLSYKESKNKAKFQSGTGKWTHTITYF